MKRLFPLVALVLTSCVIPITQEVVVGEEMQGHVVDAVSGRGIPGAKIRYKDLAGFEVVSDAEGRFSLREHVRRKTYWMPPAPVDPPPWAFDASRYFLTIEAASYSPAEFERVKYRIVAKRPEELGPTTKSPEYFRFELQPIQE